MTLRQAWERERCKAKGQHAFFTTVLALSMPGTLAGTGMTPARHCRGSARR
ncbi:hypothetical protein AB0L47_36845 [Streptomyces bobili]|uniref:hypothetical protein n=1 Tax=Streptomyces bobili TaxID=67280 RepID=UPI0034286610